MGLTVEQAQDGKCRLITWMADDEGWEALTRLIDRFLSQAVEEIATEYEFEIVDWLEINYWADSGRLICFPSVGEPLVNRDERVCLQLCSEHLENAWSTIADSDEDDDRADERFELLARSIWSCIREHLQSGEFRRALENAREKHGMKVLGYDYDPGEGIHRIDEGGVLRLQTE